MPCRSRFSCALAGLAADLAAGGLGRLGPVFTWATPADAGDPAWRVAHADRLEAVLNRMGYDAPRDVYADYEGSGLYVAFRDNRDYAKLRERTVTLAVRLRGLGYAAKLVERDLGDGWRSVGIRVSDPLAGKRAGGTAGLGDVIGPGLPWVLGGLDGGRAPLARGVDLPQIGSWKRGRDPVFGTTSYQLRRPGSVVVRIFAGYGPAGFNVFGEGRWYVRVKRPGDVAWNRELFLRNDGRVGPDPGGRNIAGYWSPDEALAALRTAALHAAGW